MYPCVLQRTKCKMIRDLQALDLVLTLLIYLMVVFMRLIFLLSIAIIEVSEREFRENLRFQLLIKFDLSKLN